MISSYGFLLHGLLALQSVFRLGRLGLQHEECSDQLVHIIRCDEEGALLLGQKSSNKKNQKIRKPLRDMTTMKQQQHLTTTSRSCKVRSLESRDGNTMQELLK